MITTENMHSAQGLSITNNAHSRALSTTNQQAISRETVIDYDIDLRDLDAEGNNNRLHTKRQVRGAAAAGGIAGLVLLGPLVGAAAAGGAALAATSSRGKGGDIVRASGDVIADFGVKLKRMDRKHRVVEKTSKSVVKGCQWVSQRLNPKDDDSSTAVISGTRSSSRQYTPRVAQRQ